VSASGGFAIRGVAYKRASPELMSRIAVALGLPVDYLADYREAVVIERIRTDPKLRDELYARLKRQRPSARRARRCRHAVLSIH
jgi:hypothetical protein